MLSFLGFAERKRKTPRESWVFYFNCSSNYVARMAGGMTLCLQDIGAVQIGVPCTLMVQKTKISTIRLHKFLLNIQGDPHVGQSKRMRRISCMLTEVMQMMFFWLASQSLINAAMTFYYKSCYTEHIEAAAMKYRKKAGFGTREKPYESYTGIRWYQSGLTRSLQRREIHGRNGTTA